MVDTNRGLLVSLELGILLAAGACALDAADDGAEHLVICADGGACAPDAAPDAEEHLMAEICADGDGDGFGNPGSTVCPHGSAVDCDDTAAATHPGALEANDGRDNQCPGDDGYGTVDELSGDIAFASTPPYPLCWPAQVGATSYEVARSTDPSFATGCTTFVTTTTCWTDTENPPVGQTFAYLVRPLTPNAGSWGAGPAAAAAAASCAPTLSPGAHIWSVGLLGRRSTPLDKAVARGIAVDSHGDVYEIGKMEGTINFGGGNISSSGDYDVYLVKYSASGVYRWAKHFGAIGYDDGTRVAVDSSDNVVIAGIYQNAVDFGGGPLPTATSTDVFLASFDSSGNHLWSRRFGSAGVDGVSGIAVRSDDLFLTGTFGLAGSTSATIDFGCGPLTRAGTTNPDIFVARLALSTRACVWSRRFGGTGTEISTSLAVDNVGDVLIAGRYGEYGTGGAIDFGGGSLVSNGSEDVFLAKLRRADGSYAWASHFGGVATDTGNAVSTDSSGGVILAGDFNGTIDLGGGPLVAVGGGNMFLAKFSASGAPAWSRRFGIGANTALAVTADPAGNVIMTGSIVGAADFGGGPLWGSGTYDVFIAKFGPGGSYSWQRRVVAPWDDNGRALATDRFGNVLLAGDFGDTIDFGGGPFTTSTPGSPNAFIVKFAP